MEIALIAAVARNGVIGRDGGLPWRLPDDMAFFRRSTRGKPLVMGRRTFDSLAGPLPGRRNIVLTRDPDFGAEGIDVVRDLDAALARAAGDGAAECMVIGGRDIYAAALPRATRMYLTRVHADVKGDVCFPEFDASAWREVWREDHPADARHAHAFSLTILERAEA